MKATSRRETLHWSNQSPGSQLVCGLLVAAVYALITVVMTWPLAAHLDTAVLGPPGDNLEYVWKMWWFREALVERGVSPFFVPDVFYPHGYPIALSETTVIHTVPGVPLTMLWGETISYNLAMLASFVVSGLGLYAYLRAHRCGLMAAFFAGAAYAFCSYRMAHLGAGHLPLMGTGWIPLLFLAIEVLVERGGWRAGALAGLCYGCVALSSWYYAVMVGLFAVPYGLLLARPWREVFRRGGLWRGLAAAALVAVLMIAPVAWPMVSLYAQGETEYGYSLTYVDQWSASPYDFQHPNAMHTLWGAWATETYYQNIHENLLYLGGVVQILALCGLWAHRRDRLVRRMALVGAVAFVLALGTTLHWGGEPVYVSVPPAVEHQFSRAMYVLTGKLALNKVSYGPMRREGAIVVPLPTLLLYLYLPFMRAMRVWSRFAVLTLMAVSALAGWGCEALLERIRARRGARAAALVGIAATMLLLADLAVLPYPYGYSEVRGQPVDEWLAQQPDGTPVMHLPLEKTWYGWMLYPVAVHGQPIAYGYGTFAPREYEAVGEVLASWPSRESLDQLREWGVHYAIVGARSYGEAWPTVRDGIAALPDVREVGVYRDRPIHHGDRLLHLVRPTADVPVTELVAGERGAFLDDEIHVYDIRDNNQ